MIPFVGHGRKRHGSARKQTNAPSRVFITLLWAAGPWRQVINLRPIINRPWAGYNETSPLVGPIINRPWAGYQPAAGLPTGPTRTGGQLICR